MTWLIPKLNERVQIGTLDQDPNTSGGFDAEFLSILTIWMGMSNASERGGSGSIPNYIRGEQIEKNITHKFVCRRDAVENLGTEFAKSFSYSFDSIEDLAPLKSLYYLFLQRGSTVKGRLFRIRGVQDVNEKREYLRIYAEEIEERGTGYPS